MTAGSLRCTMFNFGYVAHHDILASAGLELALLLPSTLALSIWALPTNSSDVSLPVGFDCTRYD